MSNNYTYTVIKATQAGKDFADGLDFPKGNISEDNTMMVVDKKDQIQETIPSELIPDKPAYVTEDMPNFPYLTHEEALALISYSEWRTSKT